MAASHSARKAVELDIVPGRCPKTVAAVAIYMASHALGMKLTKKKLCEVAGVVDVTIRETYKLMYPRSAALFPENLELDLSLLPQPYKPPNFNKKTY
jgi:transcription initiation factor TFIIB